jgi:hypothetical protein
MCMGAGVVGGCENSAASLQRGWQVQVHIPTRFPELAVEMHTRRRRTHTARHSSPDFCHSGVVPHERLPRRSTSSRNLQRTPAAPLGAQTEARSNRLRHVQTRNTMLANSTFNFPIFSFTAGSTVPTVLSVNTPPIILLGPRRVRDAGAAVWPAGGPQQARLAGPAYASTLKTRCGRVLRRRPRCVRGALTVMQSPIALPIRVELCQRFSDEAVLMALLV